MDVLQNLKTSLLDFNFVIIYIIHKIDVLLKNCLNYFKDSIFEYCFKEYSRHLCFFKQFFCTTYNDKKCKV